MTDSPTLLERIAAGDSSAVQEFLDAYGGLVWSIVRRRVLPDAAEDVVQEIFVDVWRSAARFDPERASEAAFVTTIARRRLIDHQRKTGRRIDDVELEATEHEVAESSTELERVELADEVQLAEAVLEELRPDQRRVLRLAVVDGLSHAQIAAATRMPLGTVKSHVRRGLERVRARLGAQGPVGGEA